MKNKVSREFLKCLSRYLEVRKISEILFLLFTSSFYLGSKMSRIESLQNFSLSQTNIDQFISDKSPNKRSIMKSVSEESNKNSSFNAAYDLSDHQKDVLVSINSVESSPVKNSSNKNIISPKNQNLGFNRHDGLNFIIKEQENESFHGDSSKTSIKFKKNSNFPEKSMDLKIIVNQSNDEKSVSSHSENDDAQSQVSSIESCSSTAEKVSINPSFNIRIKGVDEKTVITGK